MVLLYYNFIIIEINLNIFKIYIKLFYQIFDCLTLINTCDYYIKLVYFEM